MSSMRYNPLPDQSRCIHAPPSPGVLEGMQGMESAAAWLCVREIRHGCPRGLQWDPPLQETGLVVKHIESWNVEPSAVVKSLLKPSAKKPSNSWEKSALQPHISSHISPCLYMSIQDILRP